MTLLHMKYIGDGIEGGSLRNGTISKTVTLEARDEYDNKRGVGGDVFQVCGYE